MPRLPLKYLLILAFAVLFVLLFVIRFIAGGPEDDWTCRNGVWVKHGQPSAPMPSSECK
jgi:hypothetical protein